MKRFFLMGCGLIVIGCVLAGCEEQKKKAEDRGRIPKETLDRAKQQIDDAASKMQDRLGNLQKKPGGVILFSRGLFPPG